MVEVMGRIERMLQSATANAQAASLVSSSGAVRSGGTLRFGVGVVAEVEVVVVAPSEAGKRRYCCCRHEKVPSSEGAGRQAVCR